MEKDGKIAELRERLKYMESQRDEMEKINTELRKEIESLKEELEHSKILNENLSRENEYSRGWIDAAKRFGPPFDKWKQNVVSPVVSPAVFCEYL